MTVSQSQIICKYIVDHYDQRFVCIDIKGTIPSDPFLDPDRVPIPDPVPDPFPDPYCIPDRKKILD